MHRERALWAPASSSGTWTEGSSQRAVQGSGVLLVCSTRGPLTAGSTHVQQADRGGCVLRMLVFLW